MRRHKHKQSDGALRLPARGRRGSLQRAAHRGRRGRARRPALTVYYLGVPDTTPEFTSEAALDAYLAGTQRRGC